jgi:hypothetical protein
VITNDDKLACILKKYQEYGTKIITLLNIQLNKFKKEKLVELISEINFGTISERCSLIVTLYWKEII